MRKNSNDEVFTKKVLSRSVKECAPEKPKEKPASIKLKDSKKSGNGVIDTLKAVVTVSADAKKKEKVLTLTKQIKKLQTEITVLSADREKIKEEITSLKETLQLLKEGVISAVGSPDFIGCCVRKPLPVGTVYYYIQSSTTKEVFTIHDCEWNNYFSDILRLAKENVFLNKEDADKVCLFRNTYISQFKK